MANGASGAMVPAGQQPPLPPTPAPAYMLADLPPSFWCNIDKSTPEGENLILKAHAEPDIKSDLAIGETLPVKWILAHPVTLTDKDTGEVFEAVRSVLIAPDGTTTAFVSMGILRSLRLIVGLKGQGPWEPPLQLKIKQLPLAGGKRTFQLTLATAPVVNGNNSGNNGGKP